MHTGFLTKPIISPAVLLCLLGATALAAWYGAIHWRPMCPAVPLATYRMGETVRTSAVQLTVEQVRDDATGAGPLVPRPGYHFVIARVSLRNISPAALEFIPLLHFHVRDARGNVYAVASVPSDDNQFSGPVLPGDILREEIGFEVANGAEGLKLYFEPGTPERDMVVVALDTGGAWWGFWR